MNTRLSWQRFASSTRSFLFPLISLSLVLSALTLLPGGIECGVANAATGKRAKSGLYGGLDQKEIQLLNQGNWQALSDELAPRATRDLLSPAGAWLACSYLYLSKCPDVIELANKAKSLAQATPAPVASPLIQAFAFMCENKAEEAQKVLLPHLAENKDNVLVQFALSAVSGKQGNTEAAIAYCQKAVELAPDFAWGYRTLGFMYDRWLKDQSRAQEAYEKALALEPGCRDARWLLMDLLLARNDYDQAIDTAIAGTEIAPKDPSGYYRLAQIYMQQWRLREALATLDKAIKLAPQSARYHRMRAAILRAQGRFNDAVAEQQKAVDSGSDKAFELVELAALNVAAGNDNRAADNLKQALVFDPDNEAAHTKLVQLLSKEKRFQELVAEYKRAIARKPKEFLLRIGLARALRDGGRGDEAIPELKESANLAPRDPLPHRELAAIYMQRKDYPAAIKEYTMALNINPTSVEDLRDLGVAYRFNEDVMQAETAFVTAIALSQLSQGAGPGVQQELMRLLGQTCLDEGRYSEAYNQFDAVVSLTRQTGVKPLDAFKLSQCRALRDKDEASLKALRDSFTKLSDKEKADVASSFVDALITLGQAEPALSKIESMPDAVKGEAEWLVIACRAHALKGDHTRAEELARKAIAVAEKQPQMMSAALLELGNLELAAGKLDQAEETMRKAIEQRPKSYAAYEGEGRVFLKKGNSKSALEAAQKALELNPYFAPAYILQAQAYTASGKLREAVDSYKKALELKPASVAIHKALLELYKRLSLKDEAAKEEASITRIEHRQ